jgi:hypothetical protein
MSFPKPVFQQISEAMVLPPSYFFLRTNAGGSGDFARYSTFDDNGNISTLGISLSDFQARGVDANQQLSSEYLIPLASTPKQSGQ